MAARAVLAGDTHDTTLRLAALAAGRRASRLAPGNHDEADLAPQVAARLLLDRGNPAAAARLIGLLVPAILVPAPVVPVPAQPNARERARQRSLFADEPGPPAGEDLETTRGIVSADAVARALARDWPAPLPDVPVLARILAPAADPFGARALHLLLADASFLTAVLFGALGFAAGSRAHLASPRAMAGAAVVPDATRLAAWTLATDPRGPTAPALNAWLRQELERDEVQRAAAEFALAPDPSVETATPLPVLIDGRSAWASRLMALGRRDTFHTLRRVLHRPDLLQRHARWWLVRPGTHDEVVSAFAAARRLVVPPREPLRLRAADRATDDAGTACTGAALTGAPRTGTAGTAPAGVSDTATAGADHRGHPHASHTAATSAAGTAGTSAFDTHTTDPGGRRR